MGHDAMLSGQLDVEFTVYLNLQHASQPTYVAIM